MRRWLFFGLLVCLPLSPCAAEDTVVIAAFGESLYAGLGIETQNSVSDQLEHRLKVDGYNVNIINFGTPSDTTAGGAERIDQILRLSPQIVVVELGANDMLRGMAPEETRTNLDRILSHIHKRNIKMLVIGQEAPASYGKEYGKAYDPLFCELAKKYDAACYPSFLKTTYNHPDLMQPDGMHPNPEGIKAIVEDMYPLIVRLIKQ